MTKRRPCGRWNPTQKVKTLKNFVPIWNPRDVNAPCYVVFSLSDDYNWWERHFVVLETDDGYELLRCTSKTSAIKTARALNLNSNGKPSAAVIKEMKKRGFMMNDTAAYDGSLWRIIGGGPTTASCQFVLSLDSINRSGMTEISKIKWHNLKRLDLVQLGALYMGLGEFIRSEAQFRAGKKE